jgi:hypothetical protein
MDAMILRHWRRDVRHALALSLSGLLVKADWSEEAMTKVIHVVASECVAISDFRLGPPPVSMASRACARGEARCAQAVTSWVARPPDRFTVSPLGRG